MIDLLVVGGGPAGLATAINGAKAGLEVVVVEKRSGAIDKACGEGLMPHTLRHLDRLGVHPHGKPFRGISYQDGTPTRQRALQAWRWARRTPNRATRRASRRCRRRGRADLPRRSG